MLAREQLQRWGILSKTCSVELPPAGLDAFLTLQPPYSPKNRSILFAKYVAWTMGKTVIPNETALCRPESHSLDWMGASFEEPLIFEYETKSSDKKWSLGAKLNRQNDFVRSIVVQLFNPTFSKNPLRPLEVAIRYHSFGTGFTFRFVVTHVSDDVLEARYDGAIFLTPMFWSYAKVAIRGVTHVETALIRYVGYLHRDRERLLKTHYKGALNMRAELENSRSKNSAFSDPWIETLASVGGFIDRTNVLIWDSGIAGLAFGGLDVPEKSVVRVFFEETVIPWARANHRISTDGVVQLSDTDLFALDASGEVYRVIPPSTILQRLRQEKQKWRSQARAFLDDNNQLPNFTGALRRYNVILSRTLKNQIALIKDRNFEDLLLKTEQTHFQNLENWSDNHIT